MSGTTPASTPAAAPAAAVVTAWDAPAAQTEWDNFAVTMYEHPNRQGASTTLTRAYIGTGKVKLADEWGKKISSVVVKAGYEWCPYTKDQTVATKCFGDAYRDVFVDQLGDQGFDNNVDSHRIRKYCDAAKWAWLADCNGDGVADKVVGNCKSGTACYSERQDFCSQAANVSLSACTTFCGASTGACPQSATVESCKSGVLAGTSSDANCTDEIKAAVFKKYCGVQTPLPDACKPYIEKNIATNVDAIKRHCTADKIKTDAFCQRVLGKSAMRGLHDDVVNPFCATADGKALGLCACYDASGIDTNFSKLKDEDKARCKRRPDCTYKPCADGLKAGSAYGPDYTTLVCPLMKFCLNDVKGVTFPDGAVNKTIKVDATSGCTGGASSDDPGREDLDDLLSVAGIDLKELLAAPPPSADNTKWWLAGGVSSSLVMCACCVCVVLLLGIMVAMMSSSSQPAAGADPFANLGPL